MRFIIILYTAICIASANDFKDTWSIVNYGCSVSSTYSESKNTTVSLVRKPQRFGDNCTQENALILENDCIEQFTNDTNNFDLTKPFHNPDYYPNSYGQVSCNLFAPSYETFRANLTLLVWYVCRGRKPEGYMDATYYITDKIDHDLHFKCVRHVYVNE